MTAETTQPQSEPERLAALGAPTPEEEIKQRPIFNKQKQKVGELDYVDARFVMERLDTIIGHADWQDVYTVLGGGSVDCGIGIRLDNGDWVWKHDVGTPSNIEPEKGAYSDAFKRAAVKWGIARDLYDTRAEQQGVGHREAPAATNGGSTTQARPAQRTQQRQQADGGNAPAKPRPIDVDPDDAPWVCPEHGGVVAFPAGTSAAGRDYPPFYACPEGRDCPHRAPRGLKVEARHLQPQAAADDDDDLPF